MWPNGVWPGGKTGPRSVHRVRLLKRRRCLLLLWCSIESLKRGEPLLQYEFERAREVSGYSEMRAKIGCVLVNANGSYGDGINRRLDSSGPPYSIHAEEDALLSCNLHLVREAYLYRETKGGQIADSKPCARCLALLEDAGVKTVHFTSSHGPHFRRISFENSRA